MYVAFAPLSSHTVRFAKTYREEQIRAADESRTASEFRKLRRPGPILRVLAERGARTPAPGPWTQQVPSVR
jgi:hypothetical protein